jgi:uncharacterized membrane protein YdjX (TVP38/TMEM64 family)
MPWSKLALAAAAATMLLVAYRFGLFQQFGDPAHLKDTLLRLGALGWLAYLVAFTLLQPSGVPGVAFMVGASLVWPPPVAIALSLVATLLASATGFSFARYVARDWVETRIPARLRAYDERLATNGFATVFVLRLVFWMNPTLHALLGISRVRFWTHLAGSFVPYVIQIVAVTLLGDAAFGFLKTLSAERWVELGVVVAAAIAVTVAVRTYRRRQRA